jgi:hypothetical protein
MLILVSVQSSKDIFLIISLTRQTLSDPMPTLCAENPAAASRALASETARVGCYINRIKKTILSCKYITLLEAISIPPALTMKPWQGEIIFKIVFSILHLRFVGSNKKIFHTLSQFFTNF